MFAAFLIPLFLAHFHSSAATDPPADLALPIERFKAFLESPPAIENLVFAQELPVPFATAPTNPAQMDPRNRTKYTRYFQARSQPGCLLFRQIKGPDSDSDPVVAGPFVLIVSNEWWVADGGGFITHWTDVSRGTRSEKNPVNTLVTNRLIPYWSMMLFGLEHIESGKIHWSSNRFEADSGFDPFKVAGEVFDTNGAPAYTRVRYQNQKSGSSAYWVVRYRIDSRFESLSIPASTRAYWVAAGGEEVYEEGFHIIQIKTSPGRLPVKPFDPTPYIAANQWRTKVYKNGSLYEVLPSGRLSFLENLSGLQRRGNRSLSGGARLALAYTAFGGLNLGICVLALRTRKRRTVETNH